MSNNNNTQLPSFRQLMEDKDKSVHEPAVPNLLKRSALFVNTVGMREAPERLVLELFREIFFKNIFKEGETGARELLPRPDQSKEEHALLNLDRGRTKKKGKQALDSSSYFGPLYPEIARNAWLRKNTDRVIKFQLLDGPLAQYVKDRRMNAQSLAKDIVEALSGKPRSSKSLGDIFQEVLKKISIDRTEFDFLEQEDAITRLADLLGDSGVVRLDLGGNVDNLAKRISQDFHHLCQLEGNIPRLLWIELLKSFLRISLPAWLLAQMRLTVYMRDWVLSALGGDVIAKEELFAFIADRWKGIFHPTQTGSNEIPTHVELYVKARVELSILVYLVRYTQGEGAVSKTLTVNRTDREHISIDEWLMLCVLSGKSLGLNGKTKDDIRAEIIPYAQAFGAWLNPASKGQGKNIEEFLRIFLRLSAKDNDAGYLLTATRTGGFKGAIVFPGPAILRLMLYLAALDKKNENAQSRGKLILADLESHFASYGVDFASSVGARPKLISELSQLGLLKGSPDAGDSAELVVPEDLQPRDSRR